jgi:very-short-patch-repair endonuclease
MTKEEEFQIASKIDDVTNNNCRIIRNEDEVPYTLYCAADIGKIVNIKNMRGCSLLHNDKMSIKTKSSHGTQSTTFITYNGLLKVLTKSRKRTVYEFANAIGINIKAISFACIEASSIDHIFKTFKGEEMIEQHNIDDYILDLYFPKYRLVVECDEECHNKVVILDKDRIREETIKSRLNCTFIRYKPYDKNFNVFVLLNEIFTHIRDFQNADLL